MLKEHIPYVISIILLLSACRHSPDTQQAPAHFGFGRSATIAEITAATTAIHPDGRELPAGEGTVREGAALYTAKCAACHGATGVEGPFNVLVAPDTVGALPFDQAPRRIKAIGNYWPYSTTVFDYIRRAMPFNAPGSLSNTEVYSLTAWLLYANKLISADVVMNAKTLPAVVMPARKYYVADEER